MRPLDGLRVLDLTRLLPGGILTMLLADLGAEVIKIEDPSGGDYARWFPPVIDGQSVFFRMNNRHKRSVILNLKAAEGQAVLHRLARDADVLVESFRPGVMARLGCAYDDLKAVNPRLVYCALSGWGMDGPNAQDADHDLNYAAAAGLIGALATPQVLGGQVADVGGAYVALAGILAALLRRERTGAGGLVDTALAEAALPFMLYTWVESHALGSAPGAGGLTGGLACYRVYAAREGHVALGALEPKFWANFCAAVQRPDWLAAYQDGARQPALIAEVAALFATRTAAEWETLLSGADCCFSRVYLPAEVDHHPQFRARGMLGRFADGTPWLRSPVRVSDAEVMISSDSPAYGQHTLAVLRAAGYDEDEIAQLLQQGIIKAG